MLCITVLIATKALLHPLVLVGRPAQVDVAWLQAIANGLNRVEEDPAAVHW